MWELHKFNSKPFCFILVTAIGCWSSLCLAHAHNYRFSYSVTTTDTIPSVKKNVVPPAVVKDTTGKDSAASLQKVDSFSLKLSKDTLDGPVQYEATDSAVLFIKDQKFLLYGKTKTSYKDIILSAPKVQFDQQTNIMTAYNGKDSLGNIAKRAEFSQGQQSFQSDTIAFNFKNQKGLTKNTYTKQDQMFVQAQLLKKINTNTTFAKRVIITTCDYDEPHFGFVGNKAKFINSKIAVTGPIHPEFEGVPLPIYLPFGIFPLQQGRHSGLLPPQFADNQQYGIGLEGLGYYHVLNDNFDVTLRGNVYSYGGWSANLTPTYRVRYRYSGSMNFSVQHTKQSFKGDPDFSVANTYFLTWSHSVDAKARPGTSFSASVNAGSTKYNQYVTNNPYRNFNNNLSSSIAYSKTWVDKPYNLTLTANENQNSNTHLINLTFPDAGFTVTTLYPFQKKDPIGTPKWYEKIGVGYNGVGRNQISFYDTAQGAFSKLFDTMLIGAQHRIPISLSLPPLGILQIAPFLSYEETWYSREIIRRWNESTQKIDTVRSRKGFFTDRQVNFGIGVSTGIYGTYQFKHSRVIAIRHVVRPSVSFNYKPNISAGKYDIIKINTLGTKQALAHFDGNIFSPYAYGRFGGISFGVDNNLEMKIRSKKDTGANAIKKVKLIDGFGFTSGYNFLSDSFKLQDFNLFLRTTLFENINISAQATLDPYQENRVGQRINKYAFQGNRFSLGRLNGGNVSISSNFKSKPRDPSKAASQTPGPTNQISDPSLLQDQQRLQDYMRRNPAEFVDFNILWSGSISYSLYFTKERQADYSYKTRVSSNISFNNSFSLTPKWNFTTNGFFDFNTLQMTMFTMSISRDMHCWQMSISVTPIGITRFFNFTISPKSAILQNLRVNRSKYYNNY
ncbi:MAG: putative LPS assembly protein LptD [Flavisolibacter sp.]